MQPVGQIQAYGCWQLADLHGFRMRQPVTLGLVQHRFEFAPVHALQAGQRGEQQAP
jgi:hypothetical protein